MLILIKKCLIFTSKERLICQRCFCGYPSNRKNGIASREQSNESNGFPDGRLKTILTNLLRYQRLKST